MGLSLWKIYHSAMILKEKQLHKKTDRKRERMKCIYSKNTVHKASLISIISLHAAPCKSLEVPLISLYFARIIGAVIS